MGFLIQKTMTAYSEKLKNPKWQRKRLEVLNRDNFTCQHCKDTETELHVHHLKYTKEPYDANLDDLVTLCKDCHYIETFFELTSKTVEVYKFPQAIVVKSEDGSVGLFCYKENKLEATLHFDKNNSILKKLYESSL